METDNLPHGFDEMVERLSDQTNLSPTRTKVLALIKLQKSKTEIADILSITEKTVQNHIQDLRSEILAAEELRDIAGPTHYGDESLYEEFGGALWTLRSGVQYEKNEDTTVEKKLYGSPHGSCLLVEREIVESQGSITEERKRTEFYDGNDIPPYLFRRGKYEELSLAVLHTAFIANAGIDPVYSPSELTKGEVEESIGIDEMDEKVDSDGAWVSV